MSSTAEAASPDDVRTAVCDILDQSHVLSLATNRADGWPHVTMVNYLRIGPAIYFVIARESQKFSNIQRDDRVGIAVTASGRQGMLGLSIAARVEEVAHPHQIAEINRAIFDRAAKSGFNPHPTSQLVAVMRARPEIITLIEYAEPPGRRRHFQAVEDWRLEPLEEEPAARVVRP
jgi:Predicted flavin-nucleotide-binding protein